MTRDDSSMQEDPVKGFLNIIDQCIGRDEAWKAYHNQQMDSMEDYPSSSNSLDIYSTEAKAEDYFVKTIPLKLLKQYNTYWTLTV